MTGRQRGFSLVEVTLALGIAAFCLLVVVALLPAGILSIRDSAEATASLSFSQAVLADLRATGDPFDLVGKISIAIKQPACHKGALVADL